jgi:hypothetical protein
MKSVMSKKKQNYTILKKSEFDTPMVTGGLGIVKGIHRVKI